MDQLRNANEWHMGKRRRFETSTVTYGRVISSVSVPAERGATVMEYVADDNMTAVFQSVDFKVAAADLEIDGQLISPQTGDRIIPENREGVYEVIQNPISRKCWAWDDPYELRYRIHTKKVGTQAAQP
jgi:hypothetical protein